MFSPVIACPNHLCTSFTGERESMLIMECFQPSAILCQCPGSIKGEGLSHGQSIRSNLLDGQFRFSIYGNATGENFSPNILMISSQPAHVWTVRPLLKINLVRPAPQIAIPHRCFRLSTLCSHVNSVASLQLWGQTKTAWCDAKDSFPTSQKINLAERCHSG